MCTRLTSLYMLILLCVIPPAEAQPLEFRQVFEQHGVAMLLIDPDTGAIVDANPAAAQFYGYGRGVLQTMDIQQINTLSPAQVAEERSLAKKEGRSYFIFRHHLADGEIRTVEVHSHPFYFDGQLLLLSLIHDITPGRNLEQGMWHYQQRLEELVAVRTAEIKFNHILITFILTGTLLIVSIITIMLSRSRVKRQQMEGALRDSEGRFKRMVNDAPLGIAIVDSLNAKFYLVNPALARITGRGVEELERIDWMSITHPDDIQPDTDSMAAMNAGKIPGFQMEKRYLHADGQYFWVNITVAPMCLGDKLNPCHLLMVEDVTERKQAQLALQQKNAEMEEFASIVAHDLKSPLVTVKTSVSLLRQDLLNVDQPHNDDLNYIEKAADKMQQLLDALLQYSRIGRKDARPQILAVSQQIEDCLAALAGILQQNEIQVSTNELPQQLQGDPLHFGQIWQNLIENAVKYMDDQPQPHIEIGSTQRGHEFVFYVRDNGKGIAPEHSERIFNIFCQLNPGSDGCGLGLALVKKIVSIYQGIIWVESAGEGKGSSFMFTLPGALIKDDMAT